MIDVNSIVADSFCQKITNFGYTNVLSNGYGIHPDYRDYIIKNLDEFPEIAPLLEVDSVCSGIVNRSYEIGFKLDPAGPLKRYFEQCLSSIESNDISQLMGWNSRSSDYMKAISMIDDFDWSALFEKAFQWVRNRRYYGDIFNVIAAEAAKRNPGHFLAEVNEPLFKTQSIPYGIRAHLYSSIILSGNLDAKMARKMRSDSSEYASRIAVDALLGTSDKLYSNRDQLLIVFSDSKHQDVIKALAYGLPKHLLYSILGTDFHWLKSIIDNRMQNDEQ